MSQNGAQTKQCSCSQLHTLHPSVIRHRAAACFGCCTAAAVSSCTQHQYLTPPAVEPASQQVALSFSESGCRRAAAAVSPFAGVGRGSHAGLDGLAGALATAWPVLAGAALYDNMMYMKTPTL